MSFIDDILAAQRALGDRASLLEIHGAERRTTTAAELLALVARVRGYLDRAGVKPIPNDYY